MGAIAVQGIRGRGFNDIAASDNSNAASRQSGFDRFMTILNDGWNNSLPVQTLTAWSRGGSALVDRFADGYINLTADVPAPMALGHRFTAQVLRGTGHLAFGTLGAVAHPGDVVVGFAHGIDGLQRWDSEASALTRLRQARHWAENASAEQWVDLGADATVAIGSVAVPEAWAARAGGVARIGSAAERGVLNPQLALQGVTDRVVADLAANPSLAKGVLSRREYARLAEGGQTAAMQYGNAVERLSAQVVRNDPELSAILQYQSRSFKSTPDFFGFQGSNMRPLDITTTRSIPAHTARHYGPYTDYVLHPGLPSGLVFPK